MTTTTTTHGTTAANARAEEAFHAIADGLQRALHAGEQYTAALDAETTDFVRMNRGQVRQPGTVDQRYLHVRLVRGARHASHVLSLSGDTAADVAAARDALSALRGVLADVDDDPHLLLPADRHDSHGERGGPLPPAEAVVGEILDAARGQDLVGLYASGPVCRGFANSLGQRNWHAATTFNVQWSLYHRADKAVKSQHAGFAWDGDAFARKMNAARETLALMARPSRSLSPGKYRAYLSPAAVEEIAGLLGWGGFSGRALATKQSPLARMQEGERLDPRIAIAEDTGRGIAAPFQAEGFARPARVPLIERGALAGSLVSPRTAREFGLDANGANAWEAPEALTMQGGTLDAADALQALGDGLWIGNLHYLNYSDRPACRMTGMTRFATFLVEGGRIVAPIDVLRFDDTLFRLFGPNLVDLTREPELILSGESYGSRRLASTAVPGALVSEIAFTL
jgi:predicted Zn-dependent protease